MSLQCMVDMSYLWKSLSLSLSTITIFRQKKCYNTAFDKGQLSFVLRAWFAKGKIHPFLVWNLKLCKKKKVRCVKLKLPAILLCQYTITHLTIGFEAYLLWRGDSFSCIQKFGVFHCTHSSYNYFAVFIREFFTRPKLNLCQPWFFLRSQNRICVHLKTTTCS